MIRKIDELAINNFLLKLSHETWDTVFSSDNVRLLFENLEDFPLLLLHDDARPHTANKTNETLRNFKWEVLGASSV
jgi:hypothetical protein